MSPEKSWLRNGSSRPRPPGFAVRTFGGLKVRQKLAILHNIFFFVLAVSVYLSVIPLFSKQVDAARERELQMVSQIFGAELPLNPGMQSQDLSVYDFHEGEAATLGLSPEGRAFLQEHPTATWRQQNHVLYRNGRTPGQYRRVSLSSTFYDAALRQARLSLFIALGTIYVLSIIVLEFMIMPQYVYQPLRVC